MSEWLTLVVAALAVYRLAHMIVLETGPFAIFETLRTKVFERFGNGWINEGINCVACVSFWLALLATILLQLWHPVWFWLWWFGISGLATAIYRATE